MRLLSFTLILGISLSCHPIAKKAPNALVMTISTAGWANEETHTYPEGEPILIRCSFRNIGKRALSLDLKDHDAYHGTLSYPLEIQAKVVGDDGEVLTVNEIDRSGEGWWSQYYLWSTTFASFQAAWCHGAPGIGLARLRALELDPELREAHAAMARTAVDTTLAALESKLAVPRHDATLCHGIAGLSEIVLTAGHRLDDDSYRLAAARAAGELVRRHGAAGDWPSGMPSGGLSPSLMLGTAGIGYHLLRLHDPDRVPPVLAIMP